ncbi:hypothetical protein JCM3765_006183 [Sporobolomyces pararoseus]
MAVLVLTGCSSGLGARVLSELAHSLPIGSTIFSGYRSSTPPPTPTRLSKESQVQWIPLDLTSLDSVDQFVQQVKEKLRSRRSGGIDCILLNAATWNNNFRTTVIEGGEGVWAEEFVVNHLAQFRLAKSLLPLLSNSSTPSGSRSRIVFTSSSLQNSLGPQISSIEKVLSVLQNSADPQSAARNRYASSKLLQSLSFYHLQKEMQSEGKAIDIVGVSPGFVPTTGLSRDAPWWQQLLMKWVIYYLPFCSTEEQGTGKILETLNYLLPSNPFPSTLDEQLSSTSPTNSPDSTSSSRLVFHPDSLAPTAAKSSSKLYEESSNAHRLLSSATSTYFGRQQPTCLAQIANARQQRVV